MDTKRDHKFDHVQSRINQFRVFVYIIFFVVDCILIVFCALCRVLLMFSPVFDAKKSSDSPLGATPPTCGAVDTGAGPRSPGAITGDC